MIGPVPVIAADYQISVRIQFRQPGEHSVPFLKTGIPSAVNTEGDQAAFWRRERLCSRARRVEALLVAME